MKYFFPYEKGPIILKDPQGIIDQICMLARKEQNREHCVLALARREAEGIYELFDSCTVEEMGGITGQNLSVIPRKVSLALIRFCVKQKVIPVILHTHAPDICPNASVIFSRTDQIFMEQFSNVAIQEGLQNPYLFLVTDGQSILLCDASNMTRQYARKENLSYA